MKAWEIQRDLYHNAKPKRRDKDEETWASLENVSNFYDSLLKLDWMSNVPGSGAPERIAIAAIQALENRGMEIEGAMELLEEGYRAIESENILSLYQVHAQLQEKIRSAKQNPEHPYWKYKVYESFLEVEEVIAFPKGVLEVKELRSKIAAGWMGQLIGAAMGTQLEGYTRENLLESYGEITDYIREPGTYNDDITFEIAVLEAAKKYGTNLQARQIALEWVSRIPVGWSAEEIALRNLKNGIFPPESAKIRNPFNEWIGAQMRGAICGMLHPGDIYSSAKLAWEDASISHANNGILAELFIAMMVSLAFVEEDIERVIERAKDMIPKDSEYYAVIDFCIQTAKQNDSWQASAEIFEKRFEKYNWIHAYPNIAIVINGLLKGKGDFQRTLEIIAKSGADVDCNAAQAMAIVGIVGGFEQIPKKFLHPNLYRILTYMRGSKEITFDELVDQTMEVLQKERNI